RRPTSRCGLHVYQHVCNPIQLLSNSETHLVGNLVAFEDRNLRVNFQVQINVILQARIACKQFFYSRRSWNAECHPSDLAEKIRIGHGVRQACGSIFSNPDSGEYHDQTDGESSVMIGYKKAPRIP